MSSNNTPRFPLPGDREYDGDRPGRFSSTQIEHDRDDVYVPPATPLDKLHCLNCGTNYIRQDGHVCPPLHRSTVEVGA